MKTFVLDTNVFIHRPDALFSFRENEIVIPLWVLEELDNLKKSREERGRNARATIRILDEISQHGSLQEGVKLDNGSVLRVELGEETNIRLPSHLEQYKVDNKILLTALGLQQAGKQVFFVSKDINARLKAAALGIKAVDYEKQKIDIESLYKGFIEIDSSRESLEQLAAKGSLSWNERLTPNEYVLLKDTKSDLTALSRYNTETGALDHVLTDRSVSGVRALNTQQEMAFDLLLNDNLPLITLVGKAGTGKTLLAIAAGLDLVLDREAYTRVLVARPIIPMGKDIGYLPGAKGEKLSHWMQPIFDNLEYILSVSKRDKDKTVEQMMTSRIIDVEALTYIRGRSLPDQFIIIDEAQNLSPHEVKTIVSRAGSGTKVVLTGDPYQIDSPYLDSNSNGLTYLVEAFKGQQVFGHVTLEHSERSPLAELAAELL